MGFARSWRLIKASIAVLNADGELLLLPILSGTAALLVGGSLVWQAMGNGTFDAMEHGAPLGPAQQAFYVWLFAFYILQYFVIIFFNTALVGAAIERLDGGDPTLRSALGLACRRILPIIGYAIISATVGMVIRAIGDRGGFIGRLLAAGIDLAWTAVTFLVIPVMAAEGVGPMEAIERSGALLRKTWGESLIGASGIGAITGLGAVIGVALGAAGGWLLLTQDNPLGIPVIGLAAFIGIGSIALGSALSAVYTAAVYYYAVIGEPPVGFDRDLVRDAFTTKGGAINAL